MRVLYNKNMFFVVPREAQIGEKCQFVNLSKTKRVNPPIIYNKYNKKFIFLTKPPNTLPPNLDRGNWRFDKIDNWQMVKLTVIMKKQQKSLVNLRKSRIFAADLCRKGSEKQAHKVLRLPIQP